MNANTSCPQCGARVRIAIAGDRKLLLDPVANPKGIVWVEHWAGGTPHVKIAGGVDEVPASEALRYMHHVCGRKHGKIG